MLAVVAIVVVFSRDGWSWEWGRAISWATSSTLLLAPIAAGLAALDARKFGRGILGSIASSSVNGFWGVYLGTVIVWFGAVVAWLAGVVAAIVVTAQRADGFSLEPALAATALTTLLAAASLGAVAGILWDHVVVAPLVALAVYLLPLTLGQVIEVRDLFLAGGATGTLAGTAPNPVVTATHLLVHGAISLMALLVIWVQCRPRSAARSSVVVGSVILVAVALGAYLAAEPVKSARVNTPSANVCEVSSSGAVEVCGAPETRALYSVAAESLDGAIQQLAERGVVAASRYEEAGNGRVLDPEVGILAVDTVAVSAADIGVDDVVAALVAPRACPFLYDEEPPAEHLDVQATLAAWVYDVLGGVPTEPGDDRAASETMRWLASCSPAGAPAWTYLP
ncbi:hypothetical protein [Serinibacter salmoneus]|uniref:hypothetical protein n=1 Tax=Serinibacter salmoneus TaxID=556530 RepID=UPI00117A4ED4|nr:hypothetical protein [Serinibacter salmoneus]